MRKEVIAAINVGSNSLGLMVSEFDCTGHISILENLKMPTNIGRDTFAFKRIRMETIIETCNAIKGFAQIIKDYDIEWYRAVSTSGIREAENRDYVIEQIRMKTGLDVEIINSAQERFLTYKAFYERLPNSKDIFNEGALVVNVGSGGIEVSVYGKGYLKFTEYVKVGSLRLREILSDLEKETLDFPKIIQQYLGSKIYPIKSAIKDMHIKNFIGLGGELRSIIGLFPKSENGYITKATLDKLYYDIKSMSIEKIMDKYNLPKNQAEFLLPSLIIFNTFFKVTKAKGIYIPIISLRYGILANMADEKIKTDRGENSVNDILGSIWYIGEKYGIDSVHSKYVKKIAVKIFEETKGIHKLGEREKFYLKAAAVLHDVGKYVNLDTHAAHCYNIIRAEHIMGLSLREVNIVAAVAMYHGEEVPKNSDKQYNILNHEDKIIVSKLTAILKLAEALDMSHKQKIQNINMSCCRDKIKFIIKSAEDTLLEEWTFKNHVEFFQEIMGVKPVITNKALLV